MNAGPHIMLVEPDQLHAGQMTQSIENRLPGSLVTVQSNAHAALKSVREQHFDCIVVNQQPFGLDGLKFLELLRQYEIDMPVIMVANQMSEQSASEAINFGASEYLVKEGSYHLILPRLITEAIRRQTLMRRNRELEERLRASENISAMTIAAATLAHEISNPLTTIIGVSELLNSDSALHNKQSTRRKLRLIANSAERIRGAITSMSRMSHPVIRHTGAGPLVAESALSSKKTKN